MITQLSFALARVAEETEDFNPDDVTPGVIGFVFTALFVVAVILIGLDMYRRIRRMQYREQVKEEIEAELSGDAGGASADEDPTQP